MTNHLTEYYRQYHKTRGKEAYRMEMAQDTSRVYTLKEWLTKYVRKGGRVLDVGCGDMWLAKEMPQFEWHGIDACSLQSDGRAVEQDICSPPYPFEAASFDAVVCSEVLEHLFYPEAVNEEVRRLLKKNGTYILSTPNHNHLDSILNGHKEMVYRPGWTHLVEHIRFYDLEAHDTMLKKAGFRVAEYTGADPHFSHSFEDARRVLSARFPDIPVSQRDELLGAMFPTMSHTIILAAVPV
jgi:2-polyprenyl-3-methyl-5-hydroxy-6-metoxy-1,4-benzoquinol methylase